MRMSVLRNGRAVAVALAMTSAGAAAFAQAPPPLPPEAAAVAQCLCLQGASQKLGAEMAVRQRALEDIRGQLAQSSSELEAERGRVDVNNPQSVSRFRQLLERRDDLFRRSTGDVVADTRRAVERYNGAINEYNARCANRPMDPVLISRVQATLSCPPLY